jgi:hypothetical protein
VKAAVLAVVALVLVLPSNAPAMPAWIDDEPLTGAEGAQIAVAGVSGPTLARTGRPVQLSATLVERAGNTGGRVNVTLSSGTTMLAFVPSVVVAADGTTIVKFAATFASGGVYPLTVTVADAATGQTKDTRASSVEITDFGLVPSNVLTPSFAGFGGQMNQHLYAQISQAAGVPQNPVEVEDAVVGLQPQMVRIFFNNSDFTLPDRLDSFVRTAVLAQRAGATINVTWQGGAFPEATAQKFTDVLADLIRNRGIDNLRWVTIQNEPNSTSITPEQNEQMYRLLDRDLVAAGLRDHIRFMGGDLVQNNQRAWFQYMADHMSDILDAYSIHVFWDYWDTPKLQQRLTEVRTIVDSLPAAGSKPLYVTEYAVRGIRNYGGATLPEPGVFADGTPMRKANLNGFQHLWFDVLATKLGYRGTVKWDSYFAKYDNGTQAFYMINGPDEAWSRNPVYWATRLLTQTVRRGWRVVAVDGAVGTKLVTAFTGAAGEVTVIGLDTSGATLNGVSPAQVTYTVAGLPPLAQLHLVVWNRVGDGTVSDAGVVTTDGAGAATVTIPLQAVFALTSLSG